MNKVSYLLASAAVVAFAVSASATTTEASTEQASATEHKAHKKEGKKHHKHKGHKAHKEAAMPAEVKNDVAAMQETPKGQEPMVASEVSTEQPATAQVEGEKASN